MIKAAVKSSFIPQTKPEVPQSEIITTDFSRCKLYPIFDEENYHLLNSLQSQLHWALDMNLIKAKLRNRILDERDFLLNLINNLPEPIRAILWLLQINPKGEQVSWEIQYFNYGIKTITEDQQSQIFENLKSQTRFPTVQSPCILKGILAPKQSKFMYFQINSPKNPIHTSTSLSVFNSLTNSKEPIAQFNSPLSLILDHKREIQE